MVTLSIRTHSTHPPSRPLPEAEKQPVRIKECVGTIYFLNSVFSTGIVRHEKCKDRTWLKLHIIYNNNKQTNPSIK